MRHKNRKQSWLDDQRAAWLWRFRSRLPSYKIQIPDFIAVGIGVDLHDAKRFDAVHQYAVNGCCFLGGNSLAPIGRLDFQRLALVSVMQKASFHRIGSLGDPECVAPLRESDER
jgi:hypothetical protein